MDLLSVIFFIAALFMTQYTHKEFAHDPEPESMNAIYLTGTVFFLLGASFASAGAADIGALVAFFGIGTLCFVIAEWARRYSDHFREF